MNLSQLESKKIIPRIKRLDNRLANQIAAGEVVERPASVVKELMENAIDSGASRIEVDLERGGMRLIRVTDNGCGIVKQDLTLALSRHATSKIFNIKDLGAINSLGFRGEALASIGSVSRLCLTSRTKDSDFAWQAIAEGREMQVEIQPASATIGTRIEVGDLFYNTPARQKFLRTEKTEFGHVEEIFKRHALAHFDIAFILKHNHKIVKRIPATSNKADHIKRIQSICGKTFSDNAVAFECQHDLIHIQGWLGGINFHRSESDLQYVFVNDRPVKDKMLNHAIRQAYQGLLPPGRMPTYVIFLQVKPDKIDVNVHPTKHEVRFDEQRMIHDLLVKSVSEAIDKTLCLKSDDSAPHSNNITNEAEKNIDYPQTTSFRERSIGVGYSKASYYDKKTTRDSQLVEHAKQTISPPIRAFDLTSENPVAFNNVTPNNKVRLSNGLWIVLFLEKAYVVNEKRLLSEFLMPFAELKKHAESKPLLFPQSINLELALLEEFETLERVQSLGFIFEPHSADSLLLQQIPSWLDSVDKQIIVTYFSRWVEMFSTGNIHSGLEAIYTALMPLSNTMMDVLLLDECFSLRRSLSVQSIDADAAESLFVVQ